MRRSRPVVRAVLVLVSCLPWAQGCWPWAGRPGKDDASYREGMGLFLAGNHGSAAPHLKQFLAKGPSTADAADAQYALGAIALRQGAAETASAHFNEALRAPGNDTLRLAAEVGRARAEFVKGSYRQCRAECLEILRSSHAAPRADELLFLAAEASERSGLSAESRRYYQQVVSRFPSSPYADRARVRLGGGSASAAPSITPTKRIGSGGGSGRYSVQVAAMGLVAKAREMVAELGKRGYPATVVPISSGGRALHAVRVGSYATKAEAEKMAKRLRGAGYPALIKP